MLDEVCTFFHSYGATGVTCLPTLVQNFTLPPIFLLDSYWIPIFPVDSLWIPLIPMCSQESQLSPSMFLVHSYLKSSE